MNVADIFMSYSRHDRELVVRIVNALRARGRTVWVDLDDIIPSSKWMAEIRVAIAGSDTVIAAISPDSVASPVCQEEVSITLSMPKRLVPIVVRETAVGTVPPAVAELSYLYFVPEPGASTLSEAEFEAAIDRLVQVLDTDIEAVHTHSEILRRAERWEEKGRDKVQLLRGRELEEAEAWQVAHAAHNPPVTPGQRQLIHSSRRAASRRQRNWFAAVASLVVVMALLAGVAVVQRDAAQAQRKAAEAAKAVAIRQRDVALSGELAGESGSVLSADPELALILALDAYKDSPTAQAQNSVRDAVARSTARAFWPGHAHSETLFQPISPSAFALSGCCVVALRGTNLVQVWAWRDASGPGSANSPYSLRIGSIPGFQATQAWFADGGKTVLVLGTQGAYPHSHRALWSWPWSHSATASLTEELPKNSLLSPNGDYVARPLGDGVGVSPTFAPGRTTTVKSAGMPIAVSDDGQFLATLLPESSVNGPRSVLQVWGMRTRSLVSTSDVPVNLGFSLGSPAAFSPDDTRIALGSLEVEVLNFVRPTGGWVDYALSLPAGLSPHADDLDAVGSLAWSPNGVLAAGALDDYVRIWTAPGTAPIFLSSQEAAFGGVAFSPDGQFLATGSPGDGTVQVWQWESASSPVLRVPALTALMSGNGNEVAVGADDGRTLLWDWRAGTVRTLAAGVPLGFSPDSTKLVVDEITANRFGVFDVSTGAQLASMVLPADSSTRAPNQALFSSSGQVVALLVGRQDVIGGGYTNLAIWPWAHSRPSYWKGWAPGQASLVGFSTKNAVTFLSGTDLLVWDGEPNVSPRVLAKNLGPSQGISNIALLAGGTTLLEGSDPPGGAVEVNLKTGKSTPVLTGYSDEGVSTYIFSLDRASDLVAFTGNSGYISVWDLKATEPPVVVTSLSSGHANDISFDGAGDLLAIAAQSGVHLFHCQYCGAFGAVLHLAHQRVVRALTTGEEAAFLGQSGGRSGISQSLVQAPVITEAVTPFSLAGSPPVSGVTVSDQLLGTIPVDIDSACQVVLKPGFSASALIDCGEDGRGRLTKDVPFVELNYLVFASREALADAYRELLARVAGRTETARACGDNSRAVLAEGECSYRFPNGPSGRVVEFDRSSVRGSPPDIAWTVEGDGLPPILVDGYGSLKGDSASRMTTWWAGSPSNWLQVN